MACAVVICPLGGMLSNMIGRRRCFMALTVIGIIGYITLALSPNVPSIFVGRFLTIISASGLSATIGNFLTPKSFPDYFFSLRNRVARFFLVHDTKTGKMYQMVIKYPKSP
jgi:MFS family permease